ncbi:MAG: M48 family metallopeptidase [Clostridia bacterium]|nr:M48 family metallopeptidase [Clostridia bacterium]
MTYYLDDIPVEVERKKIKNLHLYVKPPYGDVKVTAPKYVSEKEIKAFIEARRDWIIENVEKIKAVPVISYDTGDRIPIWGEFYTLSVLEDTRYSLTTHENGTADLIVREGCTQEQKEAFILEWYRKELTERVEILLPKWEAYTGLHCSGWQSKDMKSRWGTCNTKTKKIWLNVRLAEHPVECLEYVILHELAHTVVPNHGSEFKAVLNEFMPEWKQYRKLLNKGSNS